MTEIQIQRGLKIGLTGLAIIPIWQIAQIAVDSHAFECQGVDLSEGLMNPPQSPYIFPFIAVGGILCLAFWAFWVQRKSTGFIHLCIYQFIMIAMAIHLYHDGVRMAKVGTWLSIQQEKLQSHRGAGASDEVPSVGEGASYGAPHSQH